MVTTECHDRISGMDVSLVDSLSPQQHRCLLLVGQGKTTGEIVTALGISEGTVNGHIRAGMAKLRTPTRRQAGYLVLEHYRSTHHIQTGLNLRVAEAAPPPAFVFSQSGDGDARSCTAAGKEEEGNPEGAGGCRPLRTMALIAVILAALLIVILALKPLTESARDLANAVQPGRPH